MMQAIMELIIIVTYFTTLLPILPPLCFAVVHMNNIIVAQVNTILESDVYYYTTQSCSYKKNSIE